MPPSGQVASEQRMRPPLRSYEGDRSRLRQTLAIVFAQSRVHLARWTRMTGIQEKTELANLALACIHCNRFKGPAEDESGAVRHPRGRHSSYSGWLTEGAAPAVSICRPCDRGQRAGVVRARQESDTRDCKLFGKVERRLWDPTAPTARSQLITPTRFSGSV